jgi:hypothetical protein
MFSFHGAFGLMAVSSQHVVWAALRGRLDAGQPKGGQPQRVAPTGTKLLADESMKGRGPWIPRN